MGHINRFTSSIGNFFGSSKADSQPENKLPQSNSTSDKSGKSDRPRTHDSENFGQKFKLKQNWGQERKEKKEKKRADKAEAFKLLDGYEQYDRLSKLTQVKNNASKKIDSDYFDSKKYDLSDKEVNAVYAAIENCKETAKYEVKNRLTRNTQNFNSQSNAPEIVQFAKEQTKKTKLEYVYFFRGRKEPRLEKRENLKNAKLNELEEDQALALEKCLPDIEKQFQSELHNVCADILEKYENKNVPPNLDKLLADVWAFWDSNAGASVASVHEEENESNNTSLDSISIDLEKFEPTEDPKSQPLSQVAQFKEDAFNKIASNYYVNWAKYDVSDVTGDAVVAMNVDAIRGMIEDFIKQAQDNLGSMEKRLNKEFADKIDDPEDKKFVKREVKNKHPREKRQKKFDDLWQTRHDQLVKMKTVDFRKHVYDLEEKLQSAIQKVCDHYLKRFRDEKMPSPLNELVSDLQILASQRISYLPAREEPVDQEYKLENSERNVQLDGNNIETKDFAPFEPDFTIVGEGREVFTQEDRDETVKSVLNELEEEFPSEFTYQQLNPEPVVEAEQSDYEDDADKRSLESESTSWSSKISEPETDDEDDERQENRRSNRNVRESYSDSVYVEDIEHGDNNRTTVFKLDMSIPNIESYASRTTNHPSKSIDYESDGAYSIYDGGRNSNPALNTDQNNGEDIKSIDEESDTTSPLRTRRGNFLPPTKPLPPPPSTISQAENHSSISADDVDETNNQVQQSFANSRPESVSNTVTIETVAGNIQTPPPSPAKDDLPPPPPPKDQQFTVADANLRRRPIVERSPEKREKESKSSGGSTLANLTTWGFLKMPIGKSKKEKLVSPVLEEKLLPAIPTAKSPSKARDQEVSSDDSPKNNVPSQVGKQTYDFDINAEIDSLLGDLEAPEFFGPKVPQETIEAIDFLERGDEEGEKSPLSPEIKDFLMGKGIPDAELNEDGKLEWVKK